MKNTCLTLLLALTAALPLPAAPDDQRAIDEQVWEPFTRAVLAHDLDGFFAVHSPEVIRVEGRGGGRVSGVEAYRATLQTHWSRSPAAGETFELRFTRRLSDGRSAFETGYFRGQARRSNGELRTYYGAFVVTLRREGERWKILVDADSIDGRTVTEEMFQAAQPLTTASRGNPPAVTP